MERAGAGWVLETSRRRCGRGCVRFANRGQRSWCWVVERASSAVHLPRSTGKRSQLPLPLELTTSHCARLALASITTIKQSHFHQILTPNFLLCLLRFLRLLALVSAYHVICPSLWRFGDEIARLFLTSPPTWQRPITALSLSKKTVMTLPQTLLSLQKNKMNTVLRKSSPIRKTTEARSCILVILKYPCYTTNHTD